ncbi:caspase-8-like isoform X2 [Gouania willdenowi]|uniref:caspase-8-like isoform X2 n=1 Tax=Gouania willdenowi TaxID=441366 RepID=UPI00105692BE|nr:caspase-8 isoform X2 [Gouania willdenowi]
MKGLNMDRRKLSQIDEELGSSDVEALCFLCLDVLNRKRLEGIKHARELFLRLEEKGLLDNQTFILHLLRTIQRFDLVRFLDTENQRVVETDSCPLLSKYRVMLYKIYEDMTEENLEKLKFLLKENLPRRLMEKSRTALDVFSELEKAELLSQTNVDGLLEYLLRFDQKLASLVRDYKGRQSLPALLPQKPVLSIPETENYFGGMTIVSDAQPITKPCSPPDEAEFYALVHEPRGLCVVISNEKFTGPELGLRRGTRKDEETLEALFTKFGFKVVLHRDLTAQAMREEVNTLGQRNFINEDALVVCVLSHGDQGCVFGTDEKKVSLKELTLPFTGIQAPTLTGKPKLFFIQACQGKEFQKGALPCPPKPAQEKVQTQLEEDSGPVYGETVPSDADFLIGMATVEECKSFRHVVTGSIYIQKLCEMLEKSAESTEPDDILSILTRVNKEVSKGNYMGQKQMPQPKYTLTKKLVLTFVKENMN